MVSRGIRLAVAAGLTAAVPADAGFPTPIEQESAPYTLSMATPSLRVKYQGVSYPTYLGFDHIDRVEFFGGYGDFVLEKSQGAGILGQARMLVAPVTSPFVDTHFRCFVSGTASVRFTLTGAPGTKPITKTVPIYRGTAVFDAKVAPGPHTLFIASLEQATATSRTWNFRECTVRA